MTCSENAPTANPLCALRASAVKNETVEPRRAQSNRSLAKGDRKSNVSRLVCCARLGGGTAGRRRVRRGYLWHRERRGSPANPLRDRSCFLFHRRRGITDGQALIEIALEERG